MWKLYLYSLFILWQVNCDQGQPVCVCAINLPMWHNGVHYMASKEMFLKSGLANDISIYSAFHSQGQYIHQLLRNPINRSFILNRSSKHWKEKLNLGFLRMHSCMQVLRQLVPCSPVCQPYMHHYAQYCANACNLSMQSDPFTCMQPKIDRFCSYACKHVRCIAARLLLLQNLTSN